MGTFVFELPLLFGKPNNLQPTSIRRQREYAFPVTKRN